MIFENPQRLFSKRIHRMIFLKSDQSSYTALDDKTLVAAILSESDTVKQRRMQEVIYDRFADKVYFKSLSLVKSKEIAKDLTHDVLVRVFLNLNKYRGESTFYSWVMAITYNYCIDYLEKEKKLRFSDIESHALVLADTNEIELENKILKELNLNQLESMFAVLNPKEKLILMMRYQDGMSVKKIAQILKLKESAVKMRLKRSRDHLAELLNTLKDEEH